MSRFSRIITIVCSLLMIAVLFFPIWKIDLTAPQYPEGLTMRIWANRLTGNVDIINGLNHYIGMKTLHTEDFPEFKILPFIIIGYAALGVIVFFMRKKWLFNFYALLFLFIAAASMIDFYRWEYSYGHDLNPEAPIQVPGMAYQPPLIGYKQLLNFSAFSFPDIGGFIFAFCGILLVGTALWEGWAKRRSKARVATALVALFIAPIFFSACNQDPQPIEFGKEACAHCSMMIMNPNFAGELITQKGKVYKFDDAGCLVSFINSDGMKHEKISGIYFDDFTGDHHFLKSEQSFFLYSSELNTPMGGNIIAFSNHDSLLVVKEKIGGTEMKPDDVLNSQ